MIVYSKKPLMIHSTAPDHDLVPFQRMIDKHVRNSAEAHHFSHYDYSYPIRYVMGVDPSSKTDFEPVGYLSNMPAGELTNTYDIGIESAHTKVQWGNPAPLTIEAKDVSLETMNLYFGGTVGNITPTKETTMTVDRKLFVLKATPVKAEALAHKHLGHLVTVTLPSGAEITDILVGVQAGVQFRHGDVGKVVVFLENVRNHGEYDPSSDFRLDPKSVVQVRRPRPVPAAKRTTSRR